MNEPLPRQSARWALAVGLCAGLWGLPAAAELPTIDLVVQSSHQLSLAGGQRERVVIRPSVLPFALEPSRGQGERSVV